MCAAALAVAGASAVSAQTIDAGEVMFHWGPLHMAPGQVLALNVELTDHFGDPLTVPIELHVEDKNGLAVVSRTLTMSDGHAISFVMGPDIRAARATIPPTSTRSPDQRSGCCRRVCASAFRPACRRRSIVSR
jgi:hypothetical protein